MGRLFANNITVHKQDHRGQTQFTWSGQVLEREANHLALEAFFARDQMDLGYVTLKRGDRMVEHFYSDRWYNVFAIYDVGEGAFKGWYCNITRPAHLGEADVWAEDLALDLFVEPNGREWVLDEAEFAALGLSPAEHAAACAALAELQTLARAKQGPFAEAPIKKTFIRS
jgi:hypothetical protein